MSWNLTLRRIDAYRVDAVHQDRIIATALVDSFGWGLHTRVGREVRTVARVDFREDRSPADYRELALSRLHHIAAARMAGAS
jgi:hypothetical protein